VRIRVKPYMGCTFFLYSVKFAPK